MTAQSREAVPGASPRPARPGPIALVRAGIGDLLARRRLIGYLVGADLKRTHADSLIGQLWWILDPLLQMAVYYVLVTIIFTRAIPDYPLFLFAAILPWKWFSTTLSDSTTAIVGRQSLIRQLPFPKLVLPVSATIAGTVSFAIGLIALGLVYLLYLERLSAWVLLIPVIAAVQLLFTAAVAILVSAANAFARDVQNVLRHGLRLWFYLSPGLYPIDLVPEGPIRTLWYLNPFTVLFESYRAVTWGEGPPLWLGLAVLAVVSLVLLGVAIALFKRVEPAFARIL